MAEKRFPSGPRVDAFTSKHGGAGATGGREPGNSPAAPLEIHEGGVARVTVTSSAASGFNLTPSFKITRKKASAGDFAMAPASFVIPAGQTTASVDLHANIDALTEKNESVSIKLTKGPGYKVGPNKKVNITILDGP